MLFGANLSDQRKLIFFKKDEGNFPLEPRGSYKEVLGLVGVCAPRCLWVLVREMGKRGSTLFSLVALAGNHDHGEGEEKRE